MQAIPPHFAQNKTSKKGEGGRGLAPNNQRPASDALFPAAATAAAYWNRCHRPLPWLTTGGSGKASHRKVGWGHWWYRRARSEAIVMKEAMEKTLMEVEVSLRMLICWWVMW
jgi:hypothetical protein